MVSASLFWGISAPAVSPVKWEWTMPPQGGMGAAPGTDKPGRPSTFQPGPGGSSARRRGLGCSHSPSCAWQVQVPGSHPVS